MPTVKTEYSGQLRTLSTHLQSGKEVISDAPLDNHGKGEYFSPTDLVATALGACILTIIGIEAEKHNFSIENSYVETTKIMGTNPRRIVEVKLDFYFPGNNFSEKEKKIITNSAQLCPVAKSIHPDIHQNITMLW
jgi:uncharacterized OsmC-like protein